MTWRGILGRFRCCPALSAVLAGLGVFMAVPAWAEPVQVRTALEGDLGRIVFLWQAPVGYKSVLRDGRLTVRFSRPIEASLGRTARSLGKYLSAVTPGDDGRSVVFTLKGDFDAYSYDSGSAVFVEFADKEPEPSGAAEKVSDKAAEAPKKEKSPGPPSIRVRTGQHAAYTRIVFDWPRKVPYTFKQDGGVVTVTFARPAKFNLKAMQSRPPRYIGGVRSRISGDGVTVTLSVPPTSRVKHFLAGAKVVLDVNRPSGSEKAAALPPEEAKETKKEAKEVKEAKAPAEAPKDPKPAAKEAPETKTRA